jgi:hypothetical protein
LRSFHPAPIDILLDTISLDYTESLMAAAGHQAEEALQETMKKRRGEYGRRLRRARVASCVHVGLCRVQPRSRLPGFLSRLCRRPRGDGPPWEAVGNSSKKNIIPSRKDLGKPASAKTLILGVGNVLMGDEGIGVLALKHLEAAGFGTRADLVDGGTGGFHLLGYFLDYDRLIFIDAASDGQPPGTVSCIKARFAA